MAKEEKFLTIDGITEFKASVGWCTRFMNRYELCLRQGTKIAQKLPKQLEEKVSSFHKFIIKQRRQHEFELNNIETTMTFDMPGNRTVVGIDEKTIIVKTTGHEKIHFTVILSCLADGTKLCQF